MSSRKYVGLDVHKATMTAAVRDGRGKLISTSVFQTSAEALREFLAGLSGHLHLTFEEGTPEDAKPTLTLPQTAGEADPDVPDEASVEDIGSLIKPAAGAVAKHEPEPSAASVADAEPKQKHG